MEEIVLNGGDTAWMLASTALVLLMTPGLALFYGGMVRTKSVLNMMMMSMVTIGIVSVLWVIYGFEIAFGHKADSPWYGGIGLSGLGSSVNEFANNGGIYPIPLLVFAAFQLMFAIITPALISGAIADRAKFSAWAIFVAIWSTLVYFPVAHWVFAFGNKVGDTVTGVGYLASKGVQDFAGGTAVHINAGAAGLALAIILGKRIGWRKESMRPHSLPLVMLGAALLWFGWFGFNAGSALGANGLAVSAFATTNTAAAAAGLSWMFFDVMKGKKPSVMGFCIGAVVGLVAITPGAGFVGIPQSIFIGVIAAIISNIAVHYKQKSSLDDTLDVFPCHGLGGIVGMILTGVFATKAVNGAGNDGLFYGNAEFFFTQLKAMGISVVYSFVVSFIIFKFINLIQPLRVSEEEEEMGLDASQHDEKYGRNPQKN